MNDKTETDMDDNENTGQDRATPEQAGSEQTGSDQVGTDQTDTDQVGIEQSGTYQTGAEQTGTYQTDTEQAGTEQTDTDWSTAYAAGPDEVSGGRHPVNIGHLVMGLAFAGLVVIWALIEGDVIADRDIRWLLPLPWVLAGTAGLLAVTLGNRPRPTR